MFSGTLYYRVRCCYPQCVLKLVAATAASGRGKGGALFGATKDIFLNICSTFQFKMYFFMFGDWQVKFDPVMD